MTSISIFIFVVFGALALLGVLLSRRTSSRKARLGLLTAAVAILLFVAIGGAALVLDI